MCLQNRTRSVALCGLMAALTAVSAFLRFPLPGTAVSFTLQTGVVLLSGLLLGGKRAAVAQAAYVAAGLLGAPVFSRGGGVSYVLQPEFGYLLGFVLSAYVSGLFAAGGCTLRRALLGCACGMGAVYVIALPYVALLSYLMTGKALAARTLLVGYCASFLPLDAAKAFGAAFLALALRKRLPRMF